MSTNRFAVIGTGTMGAQAAWQLARAGHNVTAFEQYAPGHPRGAAGGGNRLFRNIELEDAHYAPIVARAGELWANLETESGWRLRELNGALVAGPADAEEPRNALAAAQDEPEAEILDVHEARLRFPSHAFDAEDAIVFDRLGGVIRPELTVKAAAGLAVRAGCELRTNTEVVEVEDLGDRVRVVSRVRGTGRAAEGAAGTAGAAAAEARTEYFDRVIVAGGPWTQHLVPQLADTLHSHQLMSAWFTGRTPQVMAGIHPIIRSNPTYLYALPTFDHMGMKLGLGFEHHPQVERPEAGPRQVIPEVMEAFQAKIRRYFPGLDPEPYRVDFYYESYTPSRHEWLGAAPGAQNVIVAAGFSGHGFKMSPAIGEIAAALAVGEQPAVDISFLARAQEAGA